MDFDGNGSVWVTTGSRMAVGALGAVSDPLPTRQTGSSANYPPPPVN